jgi:hypothetical protein
MINKELYELDTSYLQYIEPGDVICYQSKLYYCSTNGPCVKYYWRCGIISESDHMFICRIT